MNSLQSQIKEFLAKTWFNLDEASAISHHKINSSQLLLREWPYTASSRDALSPSALEKSLGPRGLYFPIHLSSRKCTDTIYEC